METATPADMTAEEEAAPGVEIKVGKGDPTNQGKSAPSLEEGTAGSHQPARSVNRKDTHTMNVKL